VFFKGKYVPLKKASVHFYVGKEKSFNELKHQLRGLP